MSWNGNECGGEKNNENFKTTIPSKNYDTPKTTRELESFEYLGNMLTNDGRCTCEIKSRIAMARAAFNRRRLFLLAYLT